MAQMDLRTFQRRGVTRASGYHTCDETTGGECYVVRAERYTLPAATMTFTFGKADINVPELFGMNFGLLAFGGYILASEDLSVTFHMEYMVNDDVSAQDFDEQSVLANEWTGIGFHEMLPLTGAQKVDLMEVKMTISGVPGATLEFLSFDMGCVEKEEFQDEKLYISFRQKTAMYIPSIYYFDPMLEFNSYLSPSLQLSPGRWMVLKSCNRCGRYLPINADDELKTIGFSLHCKKRAPCTHSTFRAYSIQNQEQCVGHPFRLEDGKIVTYYGHQLECKSCKKFFVNAALNPQRNAQQFKEDGLRRRAIEVLVNNLLNRNLVHFEFEKQNKKEFSKHIWEKFGKKCFKCGESIDLADMALDHTMPLAFLYRLDETATCLCNSHNSAKSDHFPVDYYTEEELQRLSEITGLSVEILHSKTVNQTVLDLLVENVVWFYDTFLNQPDYQKVRDGILTADKINDSLKRVIAGQVDLADEYKKITGHFPTTISIV